MNPILIVDDEAAIAMLVRRILTEAGYRCQAVTDSRAAANLLEKNRYDLVLLDVMMPHLDGYDLLAYLRPTGTPCMHINRSRLNWHCDIPCRCQKKVSGADAPGVVEQRNE